MTFSLTYYVPSAPLRDCIGAHYVFRAFTDIAALPLSALMAQVNWVLDGRVDYELGDTSGTITGAAITGTTSRASQISAVAGTVLVGSGILPQGWARLTSAPASGFVDTAVPVAQIWGGGAAELSCSPYEHDEALVARADQTLLAVLAHRDIHPDGRASLIDRWTLGGSGDLLALRRTLGVSERQSARLTLALHGVSPQLLSIKYRALRAAAIMAVDPATPWDEAGGDQFVDQSHFIREFKRFNGITPGRFVRDRAALAATAMRQRAHAGLTHPLALLG